MTRYLPVLNAVRVFEAAGRHRSFTGAAQELNITHSAVSRHVRGLEEQLGVTLFSNVSRGVALTENGETYLATITNALDLISEASEDLRTQVEGSLKISSEPTFAAKWLMHHIGEFRDLFGEVNIELVSSSTLVDLKSGDFDLAIRYCTRTYDGLAADLICKSRVYPYGAPSLGSSQSVNDLLKHRLLHEDRGHLWSQWFKEAGKPDFFPPNKPNPQPSFLAIEGALAGQGIVLTSPELIENDVANGRLMKMSDVGLDFGGYYLVCHESKQRRTTVRSFRKWLLDATVELRGTA